MRRLLIGPIAVRLGRNEAQTHSLCGRKTPAFLRKSSGVQFPRFRFTDPLYCDLLSTSYTTRHPNKVGTANHCIACFSYFFASGTRYIWYRKQSRGSRDYRTVKLQSLVVPLAARRLAACCGSKHDGRGRRRRSRRKEDDGFVPLTLLITHL